MPRRENRKPRTEGRDELFFDEWDNRKLQRIRPRPAAESEQRRAGASLIRAPD